MDIVVDRLETEVENMLSSPHREQEVSWQLDTQKADNIENALLYTVNFGKRSKSPPVAATGQQQSQINNETFVDFIQSEVSPLDPNMSSVAPYSPTHVGPQHNVISSASDSSIITTNNYDNGSSIVIHEYAIANGQDSDDENIVKDTNLAINEIENVSNIDTVNIPTILCSNNNELRNISDDNNIFEMIGNEKLNLGNQGDLQIVPDGENGVKLLITDRTTGISYSVNTQELLIEHCLDDDQRLLESIAPDTILESDLLSLDDTTLRTELNNTDSNLMISGAIDNDAAMTGGASSTATAVDEVSNEEEEMIGDYISNCLANEQIDKIDINLNNRINTRSMSSNQNNVKNEEELFTSVYNIIDKPILSRARASLPEPHLFIGKVEEEQAVFAKKTIPKRSRFGPLQGQLYSKDSYSSKKDGNSGYLIDLNGITFILDTSDEDSSNWMGLVRRAVTYEEQNLILLQEENELYFITTRLILPKEELKIGYGSTYANHFNLEVLQPNVKNTWPCYECNQCFPTSEQFHEHLNAHDQWKDENMIPKRKYRRKLILVKKNQLDIVECNECKEPFDENVNYRTLYKHLHEKHRCAATGMKINDCFSIHPAYECTYCHMRFRTEILLKIHKLEHDPELSLDQNNHICPQCQRKFPTRRQLVLHVANYSLPLKLKKDESVRCGICYKVFAFKERLQKHMLVHGSDDEKPLKCTVCERRFLTNSALSGHLKVHFIGQKNFECPICKERFENVLKLKCHVPKHAQNNQYTCPHCKKIFKKYSVIRKHIRAFHSDRKYDCVHCSKIFSTLDHLKKHMLKHSDHKEFLCSDCGKQFKRRDKLFDHVKKMHVEEARKVPEEVVKKKKKFLPSVHPSDFHRFIYKCHICMVGFKRRGMLVNHLAKRHPDVSPDSVPELNLPILQATKNYYCQYCEKVYKSSSKRKLHILKNHPGAALPVNERQRNNSTSSNKCLPNSTFAQTVGSVTTQPKQCPWCHKQYASKAKLLQHMRKEHATLAHEMDCQLNDNNDETIFSNNFFNDKKFDKLPEEIGVSSSSSPAVAILENTAANTMKTTADHHFNDKTAITSLKQENDNKNADADDVDDDDIDDNGDSSALNQNTTDVPLSTDGNIMEITMDGWHLNEANGKFCNLSIESDNVVDETDDLLVVDGRAALENHASQLYQLLNDTSSK